MNDGVIAGYVAHPYRMSVASLSLGALTQEERQETGGEIFFLDSGMQFQ